MYRSVALIVLVALASCVRGTSFFTFISAPIFRLDSFIDRFRSSENQEKADRKHGPNAWRKAALPREPSRTPLGMIPRKNVSKLAWCGNTVMWVRHQSKYEKYSSLFFALRVSMLIEFFIKWWFSDFFLFHYDQCALIFTIFNFAAQRRWYRRQRENDCRYSSRRWGSWSYQCSNYWVQCQPYASLRVFFFFFFFYCKLIVFWFGVFFLSAENDDQCETAHLVMKCLHDKDVRPCRFWYFNRTFE